MLQSDFQKTGKLYPNLDAYTLDNQNGMWNYYGTSASFKTQKGFKAYLESLIGEIKLTFKILVEPETSVSRLVRQPDGSWL